jgi:hypothetical protein
MAGRMRRLIWNIGRLALVLSALWAGAYASAEPNRRFDREAGRYAEVTVTGPYLEFHTGPGGRYPVFHVVPRGEHVQVLFRRTDWFKVRDERDREGWVRREQIEQTQLANGDALPLEDPDRRDVDVFPWIVGAESGRLGHGWNIDAFAGYSPSPRLTVQFEVDHQPTQGYDRFMTLVGIVQMPRPDWRFTPFLEVGGGIAKIRANLGYSGFPSTQTQSVGYYGAGLRWAVNNRFEFRIHERSYLLSGSSHPNDPNEALNEWKAGFAFYF